MPSYLLLQIRDADDPIRQHEIDCFANALTIHHEQLQTFDLLSDSLTADILQAADMVLIGGSGRYSAVGDSTWLGAALESLRLVHQTARPTFASCWGFQAMARAMGGQVEHRPDIAEVGSMEVRLTKAGLEDELLSHCGEQFFAQLGHEDFVTRLPDKCLLLAESDRSLQAYRFSGLPIYCTQFHPELMKSDLAVRLAAYPEYVELATGMKLEKLLESLKETDAAREILTRFHKRYVLET